jgi:hypothetical protein
MRAFDFPSLLILIAIASPLMSCKEKVDPAPPRELTASTPDKSMQLPVAAPQIEPPSLPPKSVPHTVPVTSGAGAKSNATVQQRSTLCDRFDPEIYFKGVLQFGKMKNKPDPIGDAKAQQDLDNYKQMGCLPKDHICARDPRFVSCK